VFIRKWPVPAGAGQPDVNANIAVTRSGAAVRPATHDRQASRPRSPETGHRLRRDRGPRRPLRYNTVREQPRSGTLVPALTVSAALSHRRSRECSRAVSFPSLAGCLRPGLSCRCPRPRPRRSEEGEGARSGARAPFRVDKCDADFGARRLELFGSSQKRESRARTARGGRVSVRG
jgi:hypothetical protein